MQIIYLILHKINPDILGSSEEIGKIVGNKIVINIVQYRLSY